MNKDQEKRLDYVISAVIIIVSMMGILAIIDLGKKSFPVTDVGDTIVFSRAITDSPAYKQCVKKDLRTIKEFRDCLKDKGAM